MNTLEILEKFMLDQIAAGLGRVSFEADEDLLGQGIIDSLGIMKLVVFIEDTFNIKVDDAEIVPEHFQSLNSMATFVRQKGVE
jgi:acyl carrier protein